jgi:hypothetical protein
VLLICGAVGRTLSTNAAFLPDHCDRLLSRSIFVLVVLAWAAGLARKGLPRFPADAGNGSAVAFALSRVCAFDPLFANRKLRERSTILKTGKAGV